jgi:hypothetical protein
MAVLQEWPQQRGHAYGWFRRYNPRVAQSQLRRMAQWAVVVLVAVTVGSYYRWSVRATGNPFYWGYDLGGYYNYLGRAFAHGRLHLPIEPSRELLALPNPWDPAVPDSYKMQDMALFNGRYYLYHGAGPAVILFTPWRLLTGHDLPENFALFLLCFGGFLFSCGALLRVFALADATPGPLLLALMLLALGICQSVPYLLNRVFVYEIAIGGGYFCLSGAVFFLARSIESRRRVWWLAASGLMFGLAIACRPHLGLAGAIALGGLAVSPNRTRSSLAAFMAPLILVGAAVAAYNYQRFGNPFEFGIRYLLTGENQNRIKLAAGNVMPGLYFMLFCPPDFNPVFPWVRLVLRNPFNSPDSHFPAGYVIEPIVGALYCAPFIVGAFFLVRASRLASVRILLWIALASSAAVLLFLTATGFTTQRYEVDFLPLAVLAAVASLGILIARSGGITRGAVTTAFAGLVAYSVIVNLALGIDGPYDEILKSRTTSYLRIARWFSPIEKYRPMMNPKVVVDLTAEFKSQPDGFLEPLITMGRQSYRHFISIEHLPGTLRIISRSDTSTMSHEIEDPGPKPVGIGVMFHPESGKLTIAINGQEILSHAVGILVTAPAQVAVGENNIEFNVVVKLFTGRIYGVRKMVTA